MTMQTVQEQARQQAIAQRDPDALQMETVAAAAVETALAKGAKEASANAYQVRDVSVQWRDGKLERIVDATTRGVTLELYVEGRYASVSTADLRPRALAEFVSTTVALTRSITPDPYRSLPDPEQYEGQADVDLELEDPTYDDLTAVQRREMAEALEAAARDVPNSHAILSATTSVSDNRVESWRVHSNGFSGQRRSTSFWLGAEVSVQDPDGRRPEDSSYAGSRFRAALPDLRTVGREAAQRTLGRVGAKKATSTVLPMAVDRRIAGRLLSYLLAPLAGSSLQQKRSFLEGRQADVIGSALLDITDDPLIPRDFNSRLFDSEGMAARAFPLFEQGALRNYYIDTYYGKKLAMQPTTGRMSNLRWRLGTKDQSGLLSEMREGIFVTGFLGGNSNATTGDFSLGVHGFRVRRGQIAEPVAEMNISGNHLELWQRLVAVGSDPYPYSASHTPTLLFQGVQFAGV